MSEKRQARKSEEFSAAEIGALAHLYRAEVYRSTVWRTRLDTTTNWSVVTLGVALSITFSAPTASPVPLLLVGVLIMLFLALEARRYRYFNVFRARSRWMERFFYVAMLRDGDLHTEDDWPDVLADDYYAPRYHVTFMVAIARRVRHNYLWILLIQAMAYIGKLIVHPFPVSSLENFIHRARIGPLVPGEAVLVIGALYIASWVALAIWVGRRDARRADERGGLPTMG
ncbi:DUF2270 domain-containing protein [Defluviimonas sp. WL0050]|uniref:DUF2270 domain-containing protein n=1 Tax=Albidovulum litorale TaxID=2984134 RepID=A0ABT2ZLB7_9RHOB|nr:DUF2270 domain-containing protein [Defluviimonas sp. WL0050]MCV2871818.1 DUF2270 domain-containing protein [Defluviimonas sp. WL0050]